jgi:hypothetical protein
VPTEVAAGLAFLAGAAVILVALIGLLVARRQLLARPAGAFDCSMRMKSSGVTGSVGWAPGVARCESDRLEWFPFLGWSMKPGQVLRRQGLEIVDRRVARPPETAAILRGWIVVTCDLDDEVLELAMEPASYDALAMWLESAPPGGLPVFT